MKQKLWLIVIGVVFLMGCNASTKHHYPSQEKYTVDDMNREMRLKAVQGGWYDNCRQCKHRHPNEFMPLDRADN